MKRPFLSAEWRNLVMINYEVSPDILEPYLPAGVELDSFNGKMYVSFVAFHFLDTKVKGIAFPFHTHFEEVNLRFYVKRKDGNEWKRGVVFISEIVPKQMIVWVARLLYQEKYTYSKMKSRVEEGVERKLYFQWGRNLQHQLFIKTDAHAHPMPAGSKEAFIYEHYWGYTSLPGNKTGEYRVEHPSWTIYPVLDYQLNVNFEDLYGSRFSFLNHIKPDSVFVAEGSAINVYSRRLLSN